VEGKEYGFNPIKYIRRVDENKIKQNQSFFCSELVATAYITIGALTNERSPAMYFPGDFSSDENLNWANGAYLDYECAIEI